MRKLTQTGFGLWLVVLALLGSYTITQGHAEYDHSDPPADGVLTTAPTTVRVWFTQELFRRAGMNALELYGADGSRYTTGEPTIDDDDRKLLTIAVTTPLPAGEYTVHWQATSAEDGHTAEGEFAFTVRSTDTATVGAEAGASITNTLPATPTVAPPAVTSAPPTATTGAPPAAPTGGWPGNCAFGAAPVMLFAVTIWGRRRWRIPAVRQQLR